MKTWLDNKIFIFLGKVLEVILVSLLWYIGSILIVTAGTSSAALYYTVHKCIFNSEGYLFSTYKKSFTDNLKKATLLWLICLVLDAFLVFDLLLAKMAIDQNSLLGVLYYPVLVCMVLAFMWQLSVMAYQARFEDSIRAVLYKSALIAFRNMGWMIFLTLFLAGLIYLCRYLIVLVVILPGAYT
ncbi:MAG: YesL family protein, partial [Lachnospiraceae bacterium]|nr:YesL family protein [Lachnospiraceae bacterium]